MRARTALLGLAPALLLVACGGLRAEKIFSKPVEIEAVEVGRSLLCESGGDLPTARLFGSPAEVREWVKGRQIRLPDELADAPHAVVEMGRQSTGGYGVAVSRNAVRRGGLVILTGTFFSPSAGARVPQRPTSPCVVVQLPPGRYSAIEVNDQDGIIRAASEPDAPVGSKADVAETKRKPARVERRPEADDAPDPPASSSESSAEDFDDGGFGESVVIEEEPGFGE